MKKIYVFTEEDSDEIITQVLAENHDQAIAMTGLPWNTDFYSESMEESS